MSDARVPGNHGNRCGEEIAHWWVEKTAETTSQSAFCELRCHFNDDDF
ncbi:MAG: hypothetical protein NXI04_18400 [Planctomycetaceae bacterium]|nr:hypothetical protein [Planctomycetaceae bacterium]